ncbi:unnamed protein product [Blepharisma stoltei]|uniref:Uncharacterized protein n=1 Tax=Blepharisma stoltei TaxID=1481888 RepID=A0AAU9K994_9CILI|nr:unnamed protein product [Blepharisma stoltei]
MINVPHILNQIRTFHHNDSNEDDKIHRAHLLKLIDESPKKGLRLRFRKGLESQKNHDVFIEKLNCLLGKTGGKPKQIDIYFELARHWHENCISLRIPDTLIAGEDLPTSYKLWTDKHGKISGTPCAEQKFFSLYREHSDDSPLFCFKSHPNRSILINSIHTAEDTWIASRNRPKRIQRFIRCCSKPTSILRVLWKSSQKIKYFSIVNRNDSHLSKINKLTPIKKQPKRTKSSSRPPEFRFTNYLLKTSSSINNPFKLNLSFDDKKIPKKRSQEFLRKNDTFDTKRITDNSPSPDYNEQHIISTKMIGKCWVMEKRGPIEEVDGMLKQVKNFLSSYIFKENTIKGIVMDFIQDKQKNWIFLDVKELLLNESQQYFSPDKIERAHSACPLYSKRESPKKLTLQPETIMEANAEDRLITAKSVIIDESENENVIDYIPKFHIRSKSKPIEDSSPNESSIIERYNKIVEKATKLSDYRPSKILPLFDFKEQSIEAYKNLLKSGTMPLNMIKHSLASPAHQSPSSPEQAQNPSLIMNKPAFDNEVYRCSRRHLTATVDSFDSLSKKIKISKIKEQDLVGKYGGEDFWQHFILSLYGQILADKVLNKHFKCTQLENFEMICTSMYKVFNSDINMQFRRRVRAVHANYLVNEQEFESYSDIFEKTLEEFLIEEDDKTVIMSQIKSMKCLVVRQ